MDASITESSLTSSTTAGDQRERINRSPHQHIEATRNGRTNSASGFSSSQSAQIEQSPRYLTRADIERVLAGDSTQCIRSREEPITELPANMTAMNERTAIYCLRQIDQITGTISKLQRPTRNRDIPEWLEQLRAAPWYAMPGAIYPYRSTQYQSQQSEPFRSNRNDPQGNTARGHRESMGEIVQRMLNEFLFHHEQVTNNPPQRVSTESSNTTLSSTQEDRDDVQISNQNGYNIDEDYDNYHRYR